MFGLDQGVRNLEVRNLEVSFCGVLYPLLWPGSGVGVLRQCFSLPRSSTQFFLYSWSLLICRMYPSVTHNEYTGFDIPLS